MARFITRSLSLERDDEPPPTFPFLTHNVKELAFGANFHLARDATPPASCCPAGGVGAVYRGPAQACQTKKEPKILIFSGACGWPWGLPVIAANAPFPATIDRAPWLKNY